ncbi:adenylyl-sulfate kinase [Pedobacter chitinilyticus]|uniref:Adenylyl-sulfate kinase n=1 Tax=Pedobacter chitinilyticus TaxID=2233776 RepID=A0A3S3SS14_9SPHI|nr:adenylyl-sulfate kinase [Pedobacter chitinilyticus]RWU07803.1 adenylyl-sulfate kinase [Pedobacter chitinilyticus]
MGLIFQFCGLSGAGKTTLANALSDELQAKGYRVKVIDGDVYRQTLCKDLGFSRADRIENVSRLGIYAASLREEFDFIFIAVINPYEEGREVVRRSCCAKLVWIKCEIEILINRDTKGLYHKALLPDGHPDKIYNLTGLNDVFEIPVAADLVIDTDLLSIEDSLLTAIDFIVGDLMLDL